MAVLFDAYRKHISGTKPLKYTPTVELDIIFDVLDGCDMKCPGCFVERKNKFTTRDLENIHILTQEFLNQGIDANELFLGPTDIFEAGNFDQLVDAPLFDRLVEQYAALTFTSTMLTEHEELKRRVKKLSNIMAPYGKRFELFVILDIEKYHAGDKEYLEQFDRNLKVIADIDGRLKKQVNIFFIANFYPEMFDNISITELNARIRSDYGTKFKINPSFARAKNAALIEKQSKTLSHLLENQIDDSKIRNVFMNMIDIYFGGDTFHPLSYTDGRLFIAPYFYEFVALKKPELEIRAREDGRFYMGDVFAKREELTIQQYAHAEDLPECAGCPFLPNCVSRNHIQFMKMNQITSCVVPKKLYRSSYKTVEY
ncbi:hypothetical protein [Peredibacter starrii]|uniref:Radical SAM protein n=1 Tax=Peredibacter starrii TaxID=28202 RepID=A0AAX4HQP4_9BACT|nr:hypothetical protein [Peredibacter starrii]WPU65624.1 hypothetical protein SOO65_02570 [Peredibacter starrii]